MLTNGEIRGWLLRKPKPHLVRVTAGDGQIHEIEMGPNVRYVEIANTIGSLEPQKIEVFTDKNKLIRAIRPDELVGQDEAPRNESLEQDPENARLITFAQLLAEAYKDSREFTAMAFDKLGALFQAVVHKSESQEKTIAAMDRMVQKLMLEKVAESAGAAADDEPLTINTLLQSFIQGRVQAQAEHEATNGAAQIVKTNGAAKPKEGAKK